MGSGCGRRPPIATAIGPRYTHSCPPPGTTRIPTDVTEDLQLRVSTTSLTVNEGGEASYTVRLNKAPQEGETVPLVWFLDSGSDIFVEDESTCNWFDFNRENWSSGCTVTLSAGEDRNSDNEIYTVEHYITVGGWEVSGPSTRIEVRDND